MHSQPGARSSVVDTLKSGDVVDIVNCRLFWCFVKHSGTDGWVRRRFLVEASNGTENIPDGDDDDRGGGGGGGAGNAGGIGNAASGGMIAEFFRNLFGQ